MTKKKRGGCLKKLLVLLLILVALYALAGFLLVPLVGKSLAQSKLTEALGHETTVGNISLNPFTAKLKIDQFAIAGVEGASDPMFSAESLVADIDTVASAKARSLVLTELVLAKPSADVHFDSDGKLNLAQLGSGEPKEKKEKGPDEAKEGLPAITVQNLGIQGGKVSFRDDRWASPLEKIISPINLQLSDFSTARDDNGLAFDAAGPDGESLKLDATFDLEPFSTSGKVSLASVPPRGYAQIFEQFVNLDILEGALSVEASFSVTPNEEKGVAIGINDGAFTIDGLVARQGDAEPFARIPKLSITGVDVDIAGASVDIKSIASEATFLEIVKAGDGAVNLANIGIKSDADSTPETETATSESPSETSPERAAWKISLGELAFTNTELRYTEAGRTTLPVDFDLTGEALTTAGGSGKIGLDAKLPQGGAIKLDSSLDLKSGDGNGTISLAGLTMDLAKPWMPGIGDVVFDAQGAGFDGTIAFKELLLVGRSIDIDGALRLGAFSCAEKGAAKPMLKWDSVKIGKVGYGFPANDYEVSSIELDGLVARFVRESDGQINLARAFSTGEPKTEEPVEERSEGLFGIDQFLAQNAEVYFTDDAVGGSGYNTCIRDLQIDLSNVRVGRYTQAEFDITGSIDHFAPIEAKGRFDSELSKFPEITFLMKNLYLPPLTAYTERYIGRQLVGGAVSLKKVVELEPKRIEGEMKFFFDQMKVGDKVPSPDAIEAPIGMALFILSRKGKVDQEIKVSGDPSDPDFQYGSVIWSSLINVVVKLVAAPLEMVADAGGAVLGSAASLITADEKSPDFRQITVTGESLSAEAKATLDSIATELKGDDYLDLRLAIPAAVGAEGNTEAVGRRVTAVRRYMMGQHGFRPHRVLGMRPGDFQDADKDGAPQLASDGTAFHAWSERLDK